MRSIVDSTASYEHSLASEMPLVASDLREKHRLMADAVSPFPFFRATYYRWAEQWPAVCPEWQQAPRVLSVGDLHIENFGTWRDDYSRLAWGVNDFDEAAELPYASDLIRLAASVRAAKDSLPNEVKMGDACGWILQGYTQALRNEGSPFILEELHPELRAMAMAEEPRKYWDKFGAKLAPPPPDLPADAHTLLTGVLPADATEVGYFHRQRVGMGSLGRPRIAVVCKQRGANLAWEVKRGTAPPTGGTSRSAECVKHAVRSHDPEYQAGERWIRRRLGPRYSRIELENLKKTDLAVLLAAMGSETANVHLGTKGAAEPILKDLVLRPVGWLADDSKRMAQALAVDWQVWKMHPLV